jgi:hypothetical protein
VAGPELPDRATEDTDEAWGDEPDADDARLEQERPPHHDRD